MKLFILLLVAFLVLVYVYTFIKIRKRRQKNGSIVAKFNQQYLNRSKPKDKNYDLSNYKKQITKYNSQVDYIEKDKL